MPKINPKLLDAIIKKTGLSRAQVYKQIQKVTHTEYLPRALAAVKVGADFGVAISKYATVNELAQLRQAGSPVAPPSALRLADNASPRVAKKSSSKRATKPGNRAPNQVFVVHGRDRAATDALFAFLRAVGVKPIEWNSAVAMSKKPAPYIGEILDAAFAKARAVVAYLTPDDLAQLRPDLVVAHDKPYERTPTGQARPNVLFEAGMAFASHPDRTVLVQLGTVREFSDVAGRHVVHLSNDFAKRQELTTKLVNAGCEVDTSGSYWVSAGDFTDPQLRSPSQQTRQRGAVAPPRRRRRGQLE